MYRVDQVQVLAFRYRFQTIPLVSPRSKLTPMRTTFMVLALQAGLTVVISVIAGWLGGDELSYSPGGTALGNKAAFSVLVGGAISMLGSLLYGLRIFAGGGNAEEVLKRFYRGEFQKLLLTGVLFYAVIKWLDVNFLAVMIGFIASLMAFWIALLLNGLGEEQGQQAPVQQTQGKD